MEGTGASSTSGNPAYTSSGNKGKGVDYNGGGSNINNPSSSSFSGGSSGGDEGDENNNNWPNSKYFSDYENRNFNSLLKSLYSFQTILNNLIDRLQRNIYHLENTTEYRSRHNNILHEMDPDNISRMAALDLIRSGGGTLGDLMRAAELGSMGGFLENDNNFREGEASASRPNLENIFINVNSYNNLQAFLRQYQTIINNSEGPAGLRRTFRNDLVNLLVRLGMLYGHGQVSGNTTQIFNFPRMLDEEDLLRNSYFRIFNRNLEPGLNNITALLYINVEVLSRLNRIYTLVWALIGWLENLKK
jgi:hypothetical protein